jgi:hypothetical protein
MLAGGWSHSGGPNIAFWNGSTWSLFNGGLTGPSTPYSPHVSGFNFYDNSVIVTGWFNHLGPVGGIGADASNIGQWTGSAWKSFLMSSPQVLAMTTIGGRTYAAGSFRESVPDSQPADNLIAWNGLTLSRPVAGIGGGEGTNGAISTLLGYTLSGPLGGTRLVVGGVFTLAGGVSVNNIAIYSESGIEVPTWSALGAGLNNGVRALERFNTAIYAAGDFTASGGTPLNRVAQLSGSNWIAMGTGMNGPVYALKAYNGMLYAGGQFSSAGGVSTGGLARWNGSTWSNVGGFFQGTVYALEVNPADNTLVIGGQYPGINSSPNLARYSSVSGYSTFGVGGTNGAVRAVRCDNGAVYVGGQFTTAGGVGTSNVARWDPTNGWNGLLPGTNGPVYALTSSHGEIHVGGGFTSTASNAYSGAGWSRYRVTGAPWFALQPHSVSAQCHDSIQLVAIAEVNYTADYRWYKGGQPLTDGPTGHGSEIFGADFAGLAINNVTAADAGSYFCRVSNRCGFENSVNVTLTVAACCTGDVNQNGTVDIDDLVLLITHWGQTGVPGQVPGDANYNGVVDIDDLVQLVTTWGGCP